MLNRKWFLWFIWILILIPLSVDNYLSIPISHYHLRLPYFAVVALTLFWLINTNFRSLYIDHRMKAFLLMASSGFVGACLSENKTRAFLFLIWASATLILLPLILKPLIEALREWIPRTLGSYWLLQSIVILVDAAACIPTGGRFHIGRVMIYGSDEVGRLCRPHAFYQEPGYFCVFALLSWTLVQFWIPFESSQKWKSILRISSAVGLLAVFATTSRMGMMGVVALGTLQLAIWAYRGIDFTITRKTGIWLGGATLGLLTLFISVWSQFYRYILVGFLSPTHDDSFIYRYMRLTASLKVFLKNIFFGAGPGSAGAYLVNHFPNDPLLDHLTPEQLVHMGNDPLSQNMYTELLSDWGMVGTLAFFSALFFLLRGLDLENRLRLGLTLLIIFASTQTLARFDIWLIVWVLTLLCPPPNFRGAEV